MRGRSAVLLLLVAAALAPLAEGTRTFPVTFFAGMDLPLVPQIGCEIVYEGVAGDQRCDVVGRLGAANELRVSIFNGGRVRALLDDKSGPITKQLAYSDCTGGCVVPFPSTTTSRAELYVYATGRANTVIHVAVQTGFTGALS